MIDWMPDTTQVSITAIPNRESVWEGIILVGRQPTLQNDYEIAYTCATYSIRTPPLAHNIKCSMIKMGMVYSNHE